MFFGLTIKTNSGSV